MYLCISSCLCVFATPQIHMDKRHSQLSLTLPTFLYPVSVPPHAYVYVYIYNSEKCISYFSFYGIYYIIQLVVSRVIKLCSWNNTHKSVYLYTETNLVAVGIMK